MPGSIFSDLQGNNSTFNKKFKNPLSTFLIKFVTEKWVNIYIAILLIKPSLLVGKFFIKKKIIVKLLPIVLDSVQSLKVFAFFFHLK